LPKPGSVEELLKKNPQLTKWLQDLQMGKLNSKDDVSEDGSSKDKSNVDDSSAGVNNLNNVQPISQFGAKSQFAARSQAATTPAKSFKKSFGANNTSGNSNASVPPTTSSASTKPQPPDASQLDPHLLNLIAGIDSSCSAGRKPTDEVLKELARHVASAARSGGDKNDKKVEPPAGSDSDDDTLDNIDDNFRSDKLDNESPSLQYPLQYRQKETTKDHSIRRLDILGLNAPVRKRGALKAFSQAATKEVEDHRARVAREKREEEERKRREEEERERREKEEREEAERIERERKEAEK
jgi:hypothetical protein